MYTAIESLRLIRVAGADRTVFLQGQLTQDVERATNSSTLFFGWADAKGRLQWLGQLFTHKEAYYLTAPGELVDAIVGRLRMYVLRAKVGIDLPDLGILGCRNSASGPAAAAPPANFPRLAIPHDPARAIFVGPRAAIVDFLAEHESECSTENEWRVLDIRAGFPEVGRKTSGEFVPQMINLDLLDGISFGKGCYIGQEIVARTRYRGRVKRRMLRFTGSGQPPESGDPLFATDGSAGKVVTAAPVGEEFECLAVIQLDSWPGPFFADEQRSRLLHEQPLPYRVPECDSRK
jgi:folate-binding protein YgfZ